MSTTVYLIDVTRFGFEELPCVTEDMKRRMYSLLHREKVLDAKMKIQMRTLTNKDGARRDTADVMLRLNKATLAVTQFKGKVRDVVFGHEASLAFLVMRYDSDLQVRKLYLTSVVGTSAKIMFDKDGHIANVDELRSSMRPLVVRYNAAVDNLAVLERQLAVVSKLNKSNNNGS